MKNYRFCVFPDRSVHNLFSKLHAVTSLYKIENEFPLGLEFSFAPTDRLMNVIFALNPATLPAGGCMRIMRIIAE
jgi:hypothetical protein